MATPGGVPIYTTVGDLRCCVACESITVLPPGNCVEAQFRWLARISGYGLCEASLNAEMLNELRELLAENFNELINRYIADSHMRFNTLQLAIAQLDFKVIYYARPTVLKAVAAMGVTLAEIMGASKHWGRSKVRKT